MLPTLALLLAPPSIAPTAQGGVPELRIDPLLLAEAAEVFERIARDDNPLWPGWNARATPILFYLPGVQDALVNHPKAPEGFVRVASPLLPPGWTLDLRDGPTLLALDGQNTSTDVNGVRTLVVADPLSNLRPQLALLLADARPVPEREQDLTVERLAGDPYDQLALIVHEAFHVHQEEHGPQKAASEALLLQYPWLAAENNAGFALEGQALARALGARDEDGAFEAGLEWLAVRKERRARLPAAALAYEDGTEFNEGLAKYCEWKLATVLEGQSPREPMRWRRGFRGYADLAPWRARLLRELLGHCSGETVVNGDPYGSGGLRFRLYYTGMALGALLDRLGADDWRERMFEPATTLTGIVEEVLAPDASDLAAALERARAAGGWAGLLAAKKELEQRGNAAARTAAEAIRASPALLTLDFSGVDASLGLGFTPFGLTRVDAERTIYGQIPMHGQLGTTATFQQESVAPILVDTRAKTLQFALAAPLAAGELARLVGRPALPKEPIEGLDLALPGVKLQAKRAVVEAAGQGLLVKLAR
ncbi:MAG TPA: hypothetical protein VF530_11775 [Planctomycetota bacterium]